MFIMICANRRFTIKFYNTNTCIVKLTNCALQHEKTSDETTLETTATIDIYAATQAYSGAFI